MTRYLAFSACIAALVAALAWPGNADPARHARQGSGSGITASDIDANLRRSGLTPRGEIVRHGDVFVTHAVDARGIELRVVAEALFGDIVSVAPRHLMALYPARYDSGPRIIHVPGGGMPDRAALPERGDGFDEDDAPVAALPRQRQREPSARDERAPQPRRESLRPREPRQVLPYETPSRPRRESRSEPAKPQARLEVKASRSVLAIPPDPVKAAPPVTPRWQDPGKFGAPPDKIAPPLASKSADAAQASANEPSVVAPSAPDIDLPPEGITLDPPPAR